jgi:hypothetical protein
MHNRMAVRMSTIAIVRIPDIPDDKEPLHSDEVKEEEKQPARNNLLSNHKPSKDITIEHLKIVRNGIEVREILPHELLLLARTRLCDEACNCLLEEEVPENQQSAVELLEGGNSSPSKKGPEDSKTYERTTEGFGIEYSDPDSDDTGTGQEPNLVQETHEIIANNNIVPPSTPPHDPHTASPSSTLPLMTIVALLFPGPSNSQRARSPKKKFGPIVRRRSGSESEAKAQARRTKRSEERKEWREWD